MIISDFSRILYTVIYTIIMIIGTIGNLLVIVVIVRVKEMRNSTTTFLANLAIADFVFLVIWVPQVLYFFNSGGLMIKHLNKGMCYVEPVAWITLTYVSVLTVLAISFERYLAICQPLKAAYICTKSRAYKLCLLIWTFAVLFSSYQLVYTSYESKQYTAEERVLPHCKERETIQKTVYYIISLSVFSILPLIILIVLYIKIARHLKRAVASRVNIAAMRYHTRVLKMVAAVVLCFIVCQIPLRIMTLVILIVGQQKLATWMGNEQLDYLTHVSFMVLYLHSVINPILYHVMSKRFKAAFKSIVHDIVHVCTTRRRSRSSRGSTSNTTTTPTNTTTSV